MKWTDKGSNKNFSLKMYNVIEILKIKKKKDI